MTSLLIHSILKQMLLERVQTELIFFTTKVQLRLSLKWNSTKDGNM